MARRLIQTFTAEFKVQIVMGYENRKRHKDIVTDYNLSPSTFDK